MKKILFLLISTSLLITNVYPNKLDSSMDSTQISAMSFFSTSYAYNILSMVMYNYEAAFHGFSRLIRTLAEDKLELGNLCVNYMTTRNAKSNFFYHLEVENSTYNWNILNYTMNPKAAMKFILDTETNLTTKLIKDIPKMDLHAEHFFMHIIIEAQYKCVSRIQSLFSMINRDSENKVYLYEFDRSVNFLYNHLFIHPAE